MLQALHTKFSKVLFSLLAGLWLAGFAVRWFGLPRFLFFGFEQGRDAFIIQSILSLKDFVLVGPKTDIAGIFHGAWYYYLIAIPYGIGQGDPLFAAAFLVAISSLVPIFIFFLLRDVCGRTRWGILAALISIVSFELISYSRWLSNVTPAVLAMAMCLWWLWKAIDTRRQLYLIGSILMAAVASQFEIILCLWFLCLFCGGWITGFFPRPTIRTLILSSAGVFFLFGPMILFNFRNQFITFQSVLQYSQTEGGGSGSLMDNLNSYGKMLFRLMQKTLFNLPSLAVFSGMLLTVIGSSWTSNRRQLKAAGLFLAWTLMSLPVIFFPKSLSLTQLYVGTGLGLIGLLTLAIKHFSQLKWGALLAATLVGLLVFSAKQTFTSLIGNHDVFFITIQDDLNYQDQQALLAYVEQAAAGQPYRLKSFSIPYYQEEGWQYLHQFHVPDHSDIGARTIFVVIEQAVDPFWIKKWTEDLGPTQLIEERWFGKLRVQRRAISDGIPQ